MRLAQVGSNSLQGFLIKSLSSASSDQSRNGEHEFLSKSLSSVSRVLRVSLTLLVFGWLLLRFVKFPLETIKLC